MALWVLIGTCLLHWVTVAVLIRRVRETEKPLAWNLLGLAVSVLAMQQTYGLYLQFFECESAHVEHAQGNARACSWQV